jgi:hypothetical protein
MDKILDPSSKRSDRLLFEVEKFKLLGWDNFSTVTNLVDVLKQPSINIKIQQLKDLMGSQLLEGPRSQPSSPGETQSVEHPTQIAFATQVLGSINKKPAPQPVIAHSRSPNSGPNALLSLLLPNQPRTVGKDETWQDVNASVQAQENPSCPHVLSQVSEQEVVRISSKLDSINNVRQTSSSQNSHSLKDDKPSIPPRDENLHTYVHASKELTREPPPPFTDVFNAENPFLGKKRIPRLFVRVPRDQQQLLDRNDAWYRPTSDSRRQYAMIPIQVREHLITFDSQVKEDLPIDGPANPDLDPLSDGCGSGSESDSDTGSRPSFFSAKEQIGIQLSLSSPAKKAFTLGTLEPASSRDDNLNGPDSHWSPSPEAHKRHTLATLGIFPTPTLDLTESSIAQTPDIEDDTYDLTRSSPDSDRRDSLYAPRVVKVDFPSSSDVEADLEQDELHAIGDDVNSNTVQVPDTSQESPSTVAEGLNTVEVGQSSLCIAQVARLGGQKDKMIEASRSDGISSDVVIPATCTQGTQQDRLVTTSTVVSNDGDRLAEVLEEVEGLIRPTEGELASDDSGAVVISNPEDHQESHEARSSKPVKYDIPSSPPNAGARSKERWAPFRRWNSVTDSPGHSPQAKLPTEAEDTRPVPTKSYTPTHSQSCPELSAPFSSTMQQPRSARMGLSDGNVSVKRGRQNAGATATLKEESDVRDTKAMVRSGRHEFLERRLSETSHNTEENSPQIQQSQLGVSEHKLPESVSGAEEEIITQTGPRSQKSISPVLSQYRQIDASLAPSVMEHTTQDSLQRNLVPPNNNTTDFYQKYKQTYPDYCGSRNNFTWAVVYVEWLRNDKQLLHRSLIDDFIRVMCSDFINYVRTMPKPHTSGWSYYDQMIPSPQYSLQVVTPENLERALSTLDQVRVANIRLVFDGDRKSDRAPQRELGVNTTTNIQRPPAPIPHPQSSPVPPLSGMGTSKTTRRLPWVKNDSQIPDMDKSLATITIDSSPNFARNGPRKFRRVTSGNLTSDCRHSLAAEDNLGVPEQRGSPASPILGTQLSLPACRKSIAKLRQKDESKMRGSVESLGQRRRSAVRNILHRNLSEDTVRDTAGHKTKRKLSEEVDEIPQSFKRPRMSSQTIPSPTPTKTSFPQPSLSALESASAEIGKSSGSPISFDGTSKVQGWLGKPPPLTKSEDFIAKFVKRRRDSGALSSRVSTPNGTPGKRFFSIKPRAVMLPNEAEEFGGKVVGQAASRRSGSFASCAEMAPPQDMPFSVTRATEPETQPWRY